MLFLRAIPFSFAILWRYALVLPLLIIALALFALLSIIAIIVATLIHPVIGIVAFMAFCVASNVIPIMVGMRVGLQAKRVKPRNNYAGLMIPALGYGLFEGLFVMLVMALGLGVYLVASPLTMDDFSAYRNLEQGELLIRLFETSPVITLAVFGLGLFAIFAMRTALMVPYSGASVGIDPDGRPHTPFMGFGGGFVSIFFLVLLSSSAMIFAVPGMVILAGPLGLEESLAIAIRAIETQSGVANLRPVWIDIAIMVAVATVIYLYFFSLQCAGAVLYFNDRREAVINHRKAHDAKTIAEEQAAREGTMQQTDLKELLRSRMPERKY